MESMFGRLFPVSRIRLLMIRPCPDDHDRIHCFVKEGKKDLKFHLKTCVKEPEMGDCLCMCERSI